MASKISFLKSLFFLINRFISRRSRNAKPKYQKYPSAFLDDRDLNHHTLVFDVEGSLLKSQSLFPFFMLVAFEAGGVLRSFFLFTLYPLLMLLNQETGLKLMVLVCFFGIKKSKFRAGKSVLPKHFLENVGLEMFELLKKGKKRVGVSHLPRVMIEGFLKDYLEIECVVGREIKAFNGYFLGVMEDKNTEIIALEKLFPEDDQILENAIGIISSLSLPDRIFSYCKEIYMVTNTEKQTWRNLPRGKYPKPLIFHDGRLVLLPNSLTALSLFMWAPFSLVLALTRLIVALTFPLSISTPILAFSGLKLTVSEAPESRCHVAGSDSSRGRLYVCNHRTLLDPLSISFALRKKSLAAVTYSLSRVSEILAPIRTVRLTRDRDLDGRTMETLLNQGDLVVCPEGTTCREPYLLRFSPLFSEIADVIFPVAVDSRVSFFYGTTAGGIKALDPIFFLMDPSPAYDVRVLEPVVAGGDDTCQDRDGGGSRYDVANHVQHVIGTALGFECTTLTRRDKYIILAGNNGLVKK